MILKDSLYSIISTELRLNGVNTLIRLNPDHIIFKGHFPGQPILPAVALLQIVQELVENNLQTKIRLSNIPNSKFLNFINPLVTRQIFIDCQLTRDSKLIHTYAIGRIDDIIYFNIQSTFQEYKY